MSKLRFSILFMTALAVSTSNADPTTREKVELTQKMIVAGGFAGAIYGDVSEGMVAGMVLANLLNSGGYRPFGGPKTPENHSVDASGILVSLPEELPAPYSGSITGYSETADVLRVALDPKLNFNSESRYALIAFLTSKGFLSKPEPIGREGAVSELTAHNSFLKTDLVKKTLRELNDKNLLTEIQSVDPRIADGLRLAAIQLAFASRLKGLFPQEKAVRYEILVSVLGILVELEKSSKVQFYQVFSRESRLEMRSKLFSVVKTMFQFDPADLTKETFEKYLLELDQNACGHLLGISAQR